MNFHYSKKSCSGAQTAASGNGTLEHSCAQGHYIIWRCSLRISEEQNVGSHLNHICKLGLDKALKFCHVQFITGGAVAAVTVEGVYDPADRSQEIGHGC